MISKWFEMCDCAALLYGGVVGGVGGNANDVAMGVIESGRIADLQYWTAVWKVVSELTLTVEMDTNDSVQVGPVGGSSAAMSAQSLLYVESICKMVLHTSTTTSLLALCHQSYSAITLSQGELAQAHSLGHGVQTIGNIAHSPRLVSKQFFLVFITTLQGQMGIHELPHEVSSVVHTSLPALCILQTTSTAIP